MGRWLEPPGNGQIKPSAALRLTLQANRENRKSQIPRGSEAAPKIPEIRNDRRLEVQPGQAGGTRQRGKDPEARLVMNLIDAEIQAGGKPALRGKLEGET